MRFAGPAIAALAAAMAAVPGPSQAQYAPPGYGPTPLDTPGYDRRGLERQDLARPDLTRPDLALGPHDEVVVREYIIRRNPPPVAAYEAPAAYSGPDFRLRPGSFVPNYVRLSPNDDPRFPQTAFFVSPDQKVVVVDPATRTVLRIFDR